MNWRKFWFWNISYFAIYSWLIHKNHRPLKFDADFNKKNIKLPFEYTNYKKYSFLAKDVIDNYYKTKNINFVIKNYKNDNINIIFKNNNEKNIIKRLYWLI